MVGDGKRTIKSASITALILLVYRRYIDDICIVCIHREESLEKFHQDFKQLLPLHQTDSAMLHRATSFLEHLYENLQWPSPPHCIRSQPTATATSTLAALILSVPLDSLSVAKLYITSISALIHLKDLKQGFLHLEYNLKMVATQIN